MSEGEEDQQKLVSVLYSVHTKLRRRKLAAKDDVEWGKIWREHTSDKETLEEYSKAMHQLATKIWEPRNKTLDNDSSSSTKIKCRLEWVVSRCEEYFKGNRSRNEKLRLLDVGSCYNPFSSYSHLFDITALDLCPAPGFENHVFLCDFTELEVIDREKDSFNMMSPSKDVPLRQLPRNYFHVIVFSYFLEYLADTKQRQRCCEKAYELIAPNGLLFILRPDSSKVTPTGNNVIMKMLKVGMMFLGFRRIYFEKLEHLWCLAFRKLDLHERNAGIEEPRLIKDAKKVGVEYIFQDPSRIHELFCISQDGKIVEDDDDIEKDELKQSACSNDPRNRFDHNLLGELPDLDV